MRKVMLVGMLLVAIFALSACAGSSVKLTDAGKKVRVIKAEAAKQCEFRGELFATKTDKEGGETACMRDLRNRVATAGDNAMVVARKKEYRRHTEVMVHVYKCFQ